MGVHIRSKKLEEVIKNLPKKASGTASAHAPEHAVARNLGEALGNVVLEDFDPPRQNMSPRERMRRLAHFSGQEDLAGIENSGFVEVLLKGTDAQEYHRMNRLLHGPVRQFIDHLYRNGKTTVFELEFNDFTATISMTEKD